MGSSCSVKLRSEQRVERQSLETAMHQAREEAARLEACWSRFDPRSDLSELNKGRAGTVPQPLLKAIEIALQGRSATHGLFDPTMLVELDRAGYRSSVEEQDWEDGVHLSATPDCGRVAGYIRVQGNQVELDGDVQVDLGGVGKGLAADWLAELLIEHLAPGVSVCVDMGGDIRVWGEHLWDIALGDPAGGVTGTILLANGAACTSSTARRRWQAGDEMLHHLIDPRTGRPAITDLVSATVIAGHASWAEMYAKALVVGGYQQGCDLLGHAGLAGVLYLVDGSIDTVGLPGAELPRRWLELEQGSA